MAFHDFVGYLLHRGHRKHLGRNTLVSRTGKSLDENNRVALVNFARKHDNTVCVPGILIVQRRNEEHQNMWWHRFVTTLSAPLVLYGRELKVLVANLASGDSSAGSTR